MRVGSLFSGIGGFDLGLERAGMEVVFQCDNDAFANKVLAKHWPEVPRYDDVRSIGLGPAQHHQQSGPINVKDGESDAECAGYVDLICGGFPCQDLSVAGKRAGLDGERSGLWFEFQRILSELRPTWAIIENVPGLLSSNQGRDFATLLDGLGECGFGGIAWAVLDSQHFGVPQRRRRVYIVAGPSVRSVEQVLSICESGCGHPAPSRAPRQEVAFTLSASTRHTGDGHGNAWNSNYLVANTLRGRSSSPGVNAPGRGGEDDSNLVVANTLRGQPNASHRADTDTYVPVVSPALTARDYKSTREDVVEPASVARMLRAEGYDASEDGTGGRGTPLTVIQDVRVLRDKAQNGIGIQQSETMYTLDGTSQHGVHSGAAVRRLTPVECERLQGFPDDWTKVDDTTSDRPRYKACGNAVSVPVIEWLGTRIMAVKA